MLYSYKLLICGLLFFLFTAAQSIINALMAGDSPVAAEPPRLLSPDWSGDLDVQSAASSIVDHLMSKPLDISLAVEEEQQRVTDPRAAMEMRRRKVRTYVCSVHFVNSALTQH